MNSKNKVWVCFFGFHSLIFVFFAIIGGIRGYSPVPFWDMWNAYLNFFIKASDGDLSIWWSQHNEHRILLSRLLFWIDLKYFQGASWFLVIINYVLVGMSAYLFKCWLLDVTDKYERSLVTTILPIFLISWLFLWSQENNLVWGFQSQFFLAQLLPLYSLYYLQKSTNQVGWSPFFIIACAFGMASAGTMANGIVVLPFMTLFVLLTKQNIQRVILLGMLSILTLFAYFHDYHAVPEHGSIALAIRENPLGLLEFTMLYLGSPFHFIFEGGNGTALFAGLLLTITSIWLTIRAFRQPQLNKPQLGLLFFILYIGGTAFGSAGGRLKFGLDMALSSRYTTPALMAWAALFILLSPYMIIIARKIGNKILIPMVMLALAMIPLQLKALAPQINTLFQRDVAALALELGIADELQIAVIFPSTDWALSLAKEPSERNISIFGLPPIKDAKQHIGSIFPETPSSIPCVGHIDESFSIDQGGYVQVRGWIFNKSQKDAPVKLTFIENNKAIVGYALSGVARPDVKNTISKHALFSGFKGYLLTKYLGQALTVIGGNNECQFIDIAPQTPYSIAKIKPKAIDSVVTASQIQVETQWGKEPISTLNDPELSVMTSAKNGGVISIAIKRGQSLFYKGGTEISRQRLILPLNHQNISKELPFAPEWILLTFDNPELPDQFTLTLTDNGNGLAEWSSIAVKK